MGSKGGGGSSGPQTVYQSSLPEYAKPYYQQLMGGASAAAQQPYRQYEGDLVAGMNGNELNALAGYYGMGNSAGTQNMQQASQFATQSAMQNPYTAQQIQSPTINATSVNSSTARVNPTNVNAMNTSTGTFNNAAARQYMDPYMQSVVDIQKQQAVGDYQKQQVLNHNDMASRGAFGGTRQAIIDAEAQKNLMGNLGNIQAQGSSNAFNNAQSQFNTDQGRSLQSQQANQGANLQAGLANQSNNMAGQQFNANQNMAGQQFNANQNMAAQQFNAQQNMTAQQANQQAGLNAAQLNDNRVNQAIGSLGNIGSTMNQQAMQALGGISGIGNQQRDITQQQMNAAYANYQNAYNNPQNQLSWYSNILHGLPTGANTTQSSLTPQSSFASQLAGIGSVGLGAATAR